MAVLTIGELARRTGVRPSALRFYEQAGILPPPNRVAGRRRYDARAIRLVEVLRFAQQAGFTLAEIRRLFHADSTGAAPSKRWQKLAHAKLRELDTLAARAQQMRRAVETSLACGCVRLEDCVLKPDDPR